MSLALKIFVLFFASAPAYSAVTVQGVTGASNYINTGNAPRILGGTAGILNGTNCPVNTDGLTCNSCNINTGATPIFGYNCNEFRIMPGSVLTIAVKSTTVVGVPAIYNATSKARINTGITPVATRSTSDIGYLEIPWSTLCNAFTATSGTADGNCDFFGINQFAVGIDKLGNTVLDSDDDSINVEITVNNRVSTFDTTTPSVLAITDTPTDGLYGFNIQAGDEKVYISTFTQGSDYPRTSAVPFYKHRFYFSDVAPNAATDIATLGVAEFNMTLDGEVASLSPKFLDGLVNGQRFYIISAHVDESNNIGYFTDPTTPYTADPDFVYGLLSKDFECFVATATYGSADANEVITLRQFRNYLIQHHHWARPFIRFYYKISPRLADFIRDSAVLKSASRIFLWAPTQFAKFTIKHGLAFSFLIFLGPLLFLIFGIYGRRNVKKFLRN